MFRPASVKELQKKLAGLGADPAHQHGAAGTAIIAHLSTWGIANAGARAQLSCSAGAAAATACPPLWRSVH
jgi:hypothetical protein